MMFRQMITPAITRTTIVLLAVAIMGSGIALAQEDDQPKPAAEMTIAEIMKEAHKAPSRLLKKVTDKKNEASDADKQRLLDLYKSMAAQTPPLGDANEWKERTELLVAAAGGIVQGEEGAKTQLKKATNCLKCHKAHKGDD